MYKIKETVLVEGIYDKIKLSRFLDGIIFTTDGFRIFSNKKELETIRALAQKTGLVILTDSDAAGFKIRSYVKQSIPPELVRHAYIPEIPGKEKRKTKPGKEGLLGVEGVEDELILKALRQAGCTIDGDCRQRQKSRTITKADLFADGLSGRADSALRRRVLCGMLGLPGRISANMLLDVINRLLDFSEYKELTAEMEKSQKF